MRPIIDMPLHERPSVAALLPDGTGLFEFAAVAEVFALDREETGGPLYRFRTVTASAEPVIGPGGIRIHADAGVEALAEVDCVVIPACAVGGGPPPAALLDALRAAHARGARIVSVCSGAFALASAGILDGRRAVTHWRYADEFRRRFPQVELDHDVLYIDDDPVFTSAGSAAGIDLCLHLVRRDYGVDVANAVARRLVVPPHRDGGQAQYVDAPLPPADGAGRLAQWMEHWRTDLRRSRTVADMAADLAVSERSLLRRFREATGMTPWEWLLHERIRRARELLETTSASLDRIAEDCGFGSTETFRHHFRRIVRTSPARYRRQFGARETG